MSTLAQEVDLRALSDEEFSGLIDKAVRGELDDRTAEDLKDPKVIDRAYLVLVTMKKSVEGQLAAKKADHVRNLARIHHDAEIRRAEERYRAWRGGALRFKSGVEGWLMILRQAKQQRMPDSITLIRELDKQERYKFMTAYEQLKTVITDHRDHVCDSRCDGEEGCSADVRLWSAIEQ